jgi:hypothetical protein
LALLLWRELQLDQFWSKRLGVSRKGTRWDQVLFVLVAYRLLAPGSEWRLHREWFQRSALADLLGEDAGLAEIHKLYRCHDRLLVHKQAVFDHLTGRWRDLFNISSRGANLVDWKNSVNAALNGYTRNTQQTYDNYMGNACIWW